MKMSENPKTLAMLKMEKNFRAVLEKGYPRKPYEKFTMNELLKRLQEEVEELKVAIECPGYFTTLACGTPSDYAYPAMKECADVSNIVDYIFEKLGGGGGG